MRTVRAFDAFGALVALTIASLAAGSRAAPPTPTPPSSTAPASPIFATATCTPASKPGRIRCRAVLELPLEATAGRRISWGELRIVRADPDVTPLRGRLGPLDAETRDDARIVWSFSVAAAEPGEHRMTVRLIATIEPRGAQGPPTLVVRDVVAALRVAQ
jgi:hypothetical protein